MLGRVTAGDSGTLILGHQTFLSLIIGDCHKGEEKKICQGKKTSTVLWFTVYRRQIHVSRRSWCPLNAKILHSARYITQFEAIHTGVRGHSSNDKIAPIAGIFPPPSMQQIINNCDNKMTGCARGRRRQRGPHAGDKQLQGRQEGRRGQLRSGVQGGARRNGRGVRHEGQKTHPTNPTSPNFVFGAHGSVWGARRAMPVRHDVAVYSNSIPSDNVQKREIY